MTFKAVALEALTDAAHEVSSRTALGLEVGIPEAQLLFNISVAALELGATQQEIREAMKAGKARAGR